MAASRSVVTRPGSALSSRRFRRRFVLVLAVLALVAAVIVALLIGNTATRPLPLSDRPTITETVRPRVRLTAADRSEILATARLFVRSGVRRDHPARAWALASPGLRAGTTFADWEAGTLPLAPYPVSTARWNVAYSVAGEVGLDVYVESSDPEIAPLTNRLTLDQNTRPGGRGWLVDSWSATSLAAGGYVGASAPEAAAAAFSSDYTNPTPKPSAAWLLVPLLILLGALIAPLAVIVRSRRAERRIRHGMAIR